MEIILKKGRMEDAPKEYTRIVFTQETKEMRHLVSAPGGRGIDILEIGAGKTEEMNARKFLVLCRALVNAAKANKRKKIVISFADASFKNCAERPEDLIQRAAENFEMANFDFNIFKTAPKEGWDTVEEILVYADVSPSLARAAKKGQEIGKAVNACRTLANMPGGDMTPTTLAKATKEAVRSLPVKVTTLHVREMKKLGMGALLGVAKGSIEKPTFTILEYGGLNRTKSNPIVLIGKGVTFDSGGLNLKSSEHIYEMHMDMSGAAAVISAVALAARLRLNASVVGLIPAVENMPGGAALRPGDVLKSLSGKTIEVLDTDAEGRLILADALTYAKRFKPSVVVDVATLTGAAVVALGFHASALLTRDDDLAERLAREGEASGDYLWRLPLWDEYETRVKGEFADLKNVPGGSTSRFGGAIDGAMFLWQFAKELACPWAHLDIAPRMTSAQGDELAKGAAGVPVRLLVRFIEQWKQ